MREQRGQRGSSKPSGCSSQCDGGKMPATLVALIEKALGIEGQA